MKHAHISTTSRKAITRIMLFALMTLLIAAPAQAIFVEELCLGPIETDVELTNNCDGTVTADFYYDNPNDEFCFFNIFTWRTECVPCPQITIEPGFFNANLPLPSDQGQVTTFLPGKHYSHSVTFAANGVPRAWKVGIPVITHTEIAVAHVEDAPQNCPIIPVVDCVESTPEGYEAHFSVTNYNTQPTYIPYGNSGTYGRNTFTNLNNDQGQPQTFPAWPTQEFFTMMWDGTTTKWGLGVPGVHTYAPSNGEIDLEYYDEVDVNNVHVNRCENKPVNPFVSCVYDNNDGTATAWFGYDSARPNMTHIPIGTVNGGRNEIDPATALIGIPDQPEFFYQGKHDGVMSATWDTSISPYLIWWLAWSEDNSLSSAEALVEENGNVSRQCAPITPAACIMQTADGNANGYLTAYFGYANDNNFDITIAEGALNFVSDGNAAPAPGIPDTFFAGGKDPVTESVFSVPFNDDASTSWEIAGLVETATINSALCAPNELPSCDISGQTGLDCGGVTTATTLTAGGADPEGREVNFSWVVNCGQENVNFTQTVSGSANDTLDLELFDPGTGQVVAPGTCTVTLFVSDDFGSSSCFVELASTACDLDCNNEPIVQGGTPNNLEDECGECRPQGDPDANSTCLDCAGVPNGAALLDTAGACCLVSELDACGICSGDNTSCLDCVEADNSETKIDLESVSSEFLTTARRGLRQLRRKAIERGRRIPRRFIRATRAKANSLAAQSAEATANIPTMTQSCGNTILCVSVSNDGVVANYTSIAQEFHDVIDSIAAKLKRVLRGSRTGTRLESLADAYLEDALDSAALVPDTTDSCN